MWTDSSCAARAAMIFNAPELGTILSHLSLYSTPRDGGSLTARGGRDVEPLPEEGLEQHRLDAGLAEDGSDQLAVPVEARAPLDHALHVISCERV